MWRSLAAFACVPMVCVAMQSATITDREWKKWVEDVRPLLTADESARAGKVPTPEREAFRETFWSRRNASPNPQAADNAQRKEYELRVSTADKRFRHGSDGEWNDCGRTFVLLGKPDRITNRVAATHAAAGDRLAAMREQDDTLSEVWFYRNPARLAPAPSGYGFRFTQTCESLGGPAFQRLLESVAATYVAAR